MVMALLIVAFTFSSALPAYAEDGNFAKAGQKVLELKEGVLNAKKAVIERSVQVFAEDRVITAEEVFALNTAIDDFNRTKENADRDLNFYGLKTSVVLNEALVKAVKVHYFDGHYLNKRDDGAVKTFLHFPAFLYSLSFSRLTIIIKQIIKPRLSPGFSFCVDVLLKSDFNKSITNCPFLKIGGDTGD